MAHRVSLFVLRSLQNAYGLCRQEVKPGNTHNNRHALES